MQKLNFVKNKIISSQAIRTASRITARHIQDYYEKEDEVIALVILEGAKKFSQFIFSEDWLGYLNKFKVFNIRASSYANNKKIADGVINLDFLDTKNHKWEGKNILIVDDIYDTGNTLDAIISVVKKYKPKDLQCAVLLERDRPHKYGIYPKFVGIKVDTDDYLVGCGLDFNGEFRDLSYVAELKERKDKYWNPDSGEIYRICLCNKCGESCRPESAKEEGKESFYGLINALARGYYFSPVLHDLSAYRFDLCEKCLKELFDSFKLPVDELEYDPLNGTIHE